MKTGGKEYVPHPIDVYRRTIEVNLIGTFNMVATFAARAAAADELDGERGVIVNTATVAAFDGQVGQVAYSASQGGVAAMTLPVARDLEPHQIRVLQIAPVLDRPTTLDALTD